MHHDHEMPDVDGALAFAAAAMQPDEYGYNALKDLAAEVYRLRALHELGWAQKDCPVCGAEMATFSGQSQKLLDSQ